jgi:RNA polymerase sigma-70 factor (ECF subfamily)
MFGVAARDFLDVTRSAVPHPANMSTSALLTDPTALGPSLGRERARPDATAREADASLLAALRRKERPATKALYARYASRIFGLGLVLLKNEADAEDLVQDTFLKVWRTGAAFDPRRGSLDTWILLVARSLAIDLLRRRTLEAKKLSSQPSGSEVSEEPGPEWHAELGDLIRRARKAMDRLPPGQRSAVELAYLGQRSSTEVAALQRIPPGTVKSRIRAGIGTLRRALVEGGSSHPTADLRERVEGIEGSGKAES